VHPRVACPPPEKPPISNVCQQNSSPTVSFVSITGTESFFVVLRTNFSTHVYKSVRVKTDILIFASAIEGAIDLNARLCSSRARPSLTLALLVGAAALARWPRSPAQRIREKGNGNRSFLPNAVFFVSSSIVSREDVVSRRGNDFYVSSPLSSINCVPRQQIAELSI
jgi:hypothetical protein